MKLALIEITTLVEIRLVEITTSVMIEIVPPIEIVLINLMGRKTRRSNLICNHLRSKTGVSLVPSELSVDLREDLPEIDLREMGDQYEEVAFVHYRDALSVVIYLVQIHLRPKAPPSPDYIPRPEAPPSPKYIPGPEAPPSPDYIPGPEYPEYLLPVDDVLPAEEQPLAAAVSPTTESPGYIIESEPEMEPKEEDGDDEKSEEDSIEYPTSGGDDDADDDGDDLSEDDADDEDEEESSDSEEEEEEHLALTVLAPALHSSIPAFEDSDEMIPIEEGKTAATPPPFGYRPVLVHIQSQPLIMLEVGGIANLALQGSMGGRKGKKFVVLATLVLASIKGLTELVLALPGLTLTFSGLTFVDLGL
nr:hypothetical protein [Tanacetum cinerariifolium]